MKRRNFLEKSLTTSGALLVPGASFAAINNQMASNDVPIDKDDNETIFDEVVIERSVCGKPHQGKVLAIIQPHCDDIPIFAGGTVAKLKLRYSPSDKKIGEKYGLEWAERFHYIGPVPSNQDDYIAKNAVPLKK